jgi:hypothetical protein
MANDNITEYDAIARYVAQTTAAMPQFVVENYPRFVEFIKAYFRWSITEGSGAALNYMKINNDIDLVADEMLHCYTNLLAPNVPREMKADYRMFIKFLTEFYSIKGTDESFKVLYRALFDEDVYLYYPRRNVFQTSSAQWASTPYFMVEYAGDGFALIGAELKGSVAGFTCLVNNVVQYDGNWLIYFEQSSGEFEPGETLRINNTLGTCTVIPVFAIDSIDSKSRWFDGDSFVLSNGVVIKVDKIFYGYITSVSISDGGVGYSVGDQIVTESNHSGTGFLAVVTSVDSNGAVTGISQRRQGFGYVNPNIRFVSTDRKGTGLVLVPVWNPEFQKIQHATVVRNVEKMTPGQISLSFGDGESITLSDGVYTRPSFWTLLRDAPSTPTATLHDSDFYQYFSYVLVSNAAVGDSAASIKKLLHIAGLKMFIQRTVSSSHQMGVSFDMDVQVS